MKNLTKIVRLLPVEKLKPIEILTNSNKAGSKHYKLFKAIKEGEVNSDKEAKAFLQVSSKSYSVSKLRFKEKVLNLFLFILPEKVFKNPLNKTLFKVYKNLFLCRVFMLFGAYGIALNFSEKTISITQKHELYEPLFEALQLYLKIASISAKSENWKKYNTLYLEVKAKKYKLEEANYLYTQMAYTLNVEKFYEVDISKLEKWNKRIKNIARRVDCFQTSELDFLSDSLFFQITEKYYQQIKKCDKYLSYLQSKFKEVSIKNKFQVLFYKFNAQFYLKQYKNAEKTALEIIDFMPKHTKNYIYFMQIYFLLKMHTNKYVEAYNIWEQAVELNPAFKGIPDLKKEMWHVCYSYLMIISKIHSKSTNFAHSISSVNIIKMLPKLSKDKLHMNAHVRILNIISLIENEEYEKVLDQIEALIAYDKRYMKSFLKPHFQRTHYFIKILEYFAKKSFNSNDIKVFQILHYQKLKKLKPIYYKNNFIEIIPYEILVFKVYNQLKAKEPIKLI